MNGGSCGRRATIVAAIALLLAGPARADDASRFAFFEEKVRPVLSERCYECHSAGARKLESDLLLDSAAGVARGGRKGPVIVPGDPEASRLVRAIRYGDERLRMPPDGPLPPRDVAAIEKWVRDGAPDPRDAPLPPRRDPRDHFAFQPLAAVELPAVAAPSECRTPIDRFFHRALEDAGRAPAPPADRRVLARRLSFDLVGLPPDPDDVDAFAAGGSLEDFVDRLLASPRFGEKWARHWLDVARFAESHGFEHDYDRPHAWPYRDFVVRALNDDLPFDLFVRWQIAGDEIAPESPLAMMATGFLAAGVHSTQITMNQVEKERYDEMDDMLRTTGTAMLGLTIGCARCHDHKFDPIPANDYYRMLAAFTTTVRSEIEIDVDREGDARALAEWERRLSRLEAERDAFDEAAFEARFEAFLRDPPAAIAPAERPVWTILDPASAVSRGGAAFARQSDGSILAGGTNPDSDTVTLVALTAARPITAIRIEALSDPSLVKGGPGRADNGNFALSHLEVTAAPLDGSADPLVVELANPVATFEQERLPASAAIDGDPQSGWAIDPKFGEDHAVAFETADDVGFEGGTVLTVTMDFRTNIRHAIARPRLSVSSAPRPTPLEGLAVPRSEIEALVALDATKDLHEEQRAALRRFFRRRDPEWRRLDGAVRDHLARKPKPTRITALVATEGLPAVRLHTQGADFLPVTHVLERGDPERKLAVAESGFLSILSRAPEGTWRLEPPAGSRTSHRRHALADWITDVDRGAGALLARVAVNRLVHHLFGRGLVATPSDFGVQCDPPAHPELLEHLSGDLVRGGWRLKPLIRSIVTSAAYLRAAGEGNDAVFSRPARRRLEAEAIRDAMLFVSGLLDETMGGPGTLDAGSNRRSLYLTVKRSQPVPMMALFDAPDPSQGVDRRPVTSVAPQALLLLNDADVREWAEAFARRIADTAGAGDAERIRAAFRIAYAREPAPEEARACVSFLAAQRASYVERGAADHSLADLAHALLASNEFIHVD